MPKVHLHVHLESAVRWSTIEQLSAAHGLPFPAHLSDGAHRFRDFADFFDQNDVVRACLRRPEDFERIAYEFCEDESAGGTRYAEVSLSAAGHGERLGDLDMPLASVLRGLARGRETCGIECRVLIDHSRRRSVERAWRGLDLATRYAGEGVVGLGLAGDEEFAAAPFVPVFEAAHEAGLGITHHAGEACGPQSVREALGPGRADRIGHGIRAVDDAELLAELRHRRIPLEVCPSSNVALGFATSWERHPLPRLRDAGVIVTLNTDIPALVGTTLTQEYERARAIWGFSDEALAELARCAVDVSFAPDDLKRRLRRAVESWLVPTPPAPGGNG